jgi:hypothetical protein
MHFNVLLAEPKGTVLDFVAAMEHCSVRDVGLKVQGWFSVSTANATTKPPASEQAVEIGDRAQPSKPLAVPAAGHRSSSACLA